MFTNREIVVNKFDKTCIIMHHNVGFSQNGSHINYKVGKKNTFRGSGGALTGSSGVLYISSSGISGCCADGLYVTLVEWGWG